MISKIKPSKTSQDLSAKHFSRYGEFLASFELSKRGWDVYTPVYDEYIDLIIYKIICSACEKSWAAKHRLFCQKCKQEISATKKKDIVANGKCRDCNHLFLKKNQISCPKCKSKNLLNLPTCPLCKKGVVAIEKNICSCGSQKPIKKIRTIQVKASRLEYKNNKPTTYAVDLKPRDLAQGTDHFYIWVCIDENERHYFLVIPIADFIQKAKNFINSTSFLKDQGREHFSSKNFGKWKNFKDSFKLLE